MANLSNADLRGADLREARVTEKELKVAIIDETQKIQVR